MLKLIYAILIMISIASASSLDLDGNTEKSNLNKEKIIYSEMINYLKNSTFSKDMIALGTIYVNGIPDKDDLGETINADPLLSEKYFKKAIEMGDDKADALLGGLYLYNDNMKRIDVNGEKAFFYITKAYRAGNVEMSSILADLHFQKKEFRKGVKVLMKGDEYNDSSSQFALALAFKKGLRDDNAVYVLEKNDETANFYLNKACLNENKTKKIHDLCYNNSKYIEMINN